MAIKKKQSQPATKADVIAVKKDLGVVKEDVAVVKKDVAAVKQDVTTVKEDIKRLDIKIDHVAEKIVRKVVRQMEVLLENRGSEWLGVTGEEVKLMKDKQAEHEERITTVEQKIGLRS